MSIRGARRAINITGSADLALHEVNDASTLIQEEAHEDANIIFGAVIDESMGDEIRITVIATGFGASRAAAHPVAMTARPAAATATATATVSASGSRPVAAVAQASARRVSAGSATATVRCAASAPSSMRAASPSSAAHEDDPNVPDRPQTEFHIRRGRVDRLRVAGLRYQTK